jgi:hypothetical protein
MEGPRLSSGSQEKRAEVLGELAREFRQFNELGASFFRAAARIGMTVTETTRGNRSERNVGCSL